MAWNFSVGDRVEVAHYPTKYNGMSLFGQVGTVRSVYGYSIAVELDNIKNPKSARNVFYFGPTHLLPLDLDDFTAAVRTYADRDVEQTKEIYEKMKEEEIPMLKNYKVAGIKFQNGSNSDKTYPYALYDEDIVIGDTVVVQTGHHGMSIAEICSIGEQGKDAVSCGREIVCKVDLTAFQERRAKAKRAAELKKQMDEMTEELQAIAVFEMLAEKNPAMKKLLDEFKSLNV